MYAFFETEKGKVCPTCVFFLINHKFNTVYLKTKKPNIFDFLQIFYFCWILRQQIAFLWNLPMVVAKTTLVQQGHGIQSFYGWNRFRKKKNYS